MVDAAEKKNTTVELETKHGAMNDTDPLSWRFAFFFFAAVSCLVGVGLLLAECNESALAAACVGATILKATVVEDVGPWDLHRTF